MERVPVSSEVTEIINTMLNTVIRNVENDNIEQSDIMPLCVYYPMLVLFNIMPKITKEEYCAQILRNWDRVKGNLCGNQQTNYVLVEQSKTLTLNDEG